MSVNSNHPTYLQFVNNELLTLNFFTSYPILASSFRNLAVDAKNTYALYQGVKGPQLESRNFEFGTNFEIDVEGKLGQLTIECILEPKFNLASYVIAVCRKKNTSYSILRKFHFDYAIPTTNGKAPKPVYHMQYGGVVSPQLKSLRVSVDSLHPKISIPRLNSIPMNLALLIDMAFCEFRTPVTNKIVNDDKWKKLIKHNEHLLLKPYYEKYNQFITSNHSSTFLMREFNYGR